MRAWLMIAVFTWAQMCQAQLVTIPIPGAPGLSVTVATGTAAQPLAQINSSPNAVNVTMADDANVSVPLQFVFPYWGQQFTQSWMHSNGVVSFQNPTVTGNFCCTGQNLATTQASGLNYAIMPLWTDLIAQSGSHWYLSRPNDMTYAWYNVNQYGTSNTSSFEVKIDRWGLVDMRLQGALITASPVTIGMTGDLAQGQYVQQFHGSDFSTPALQISALAGTTYVDPCLTNPLSAPTCPGYAAAYLAQQCAISVLYDPVCPGYQQAYFEQQCSMNPLYNATCPGYAKAYFDKQCSLDGLYDRECPNFATAYATQQLVSQTATSSGSQPVTAAVTSPEPVVVTSAAPSASPADVTTAVPLAPVAPSLAGPSSITAAGTTSAPAATTGNATAAAPTTRAQQLAQARQQAMKTAMAAQGAAAQERAARATSLESQREAQDSVITVMGFNPAFAAYENKVLRDAQFYQPRVIYPGQTTVDNRRALGALTGTSDRRWQNMRDQQWGLETQP